MTKQMMFAILAAGTMLAGCMTTTNGLASRDFQKMTGTEIRQILPGNSLDGKDNDGRYVIHYTSASTMTIRYRGRVETGVWRVTGDQYCRRWQTFGNGKERCVTMYRKGNQINWVRDGKITDRSVLLAGNPAGL
ncbi:MAG: hypothetical protein JXQ79_06755 [Rhodobacteraceae bacterium]|nr:hypothetical protein [Paracoccaceae bacterium]